MGEDRIVNIGTQKYTKVVALDEPSNGNACHHFEVLPVDEKSVGPLTRVNFQKGPIKEAGVNGCMNEDLLAMVMDRLQGFQGSQFKCRENALAITKLEEALHWLRHRTVAREMRGVEGTHTV